MKSVALIVRGGTEMALGEALQRLFPKVTFRRPVQRDGFTSMVLPETPMLGGRTLPDVEKLARELVTEVEPGRREAVPDMAILVDDLELSNQAQPERAIEHVRRAVLRYIEHYAWPSRASHARARERVRERCSFHLLDPMVETYFFGEAQALVRAGAKRPSTVDPQAVDLERFEVTSDPDFLERPDHPLGEEIPPWARPQRANHPKAYLQFLCDPSGTERRAYREGRDGGCALRKLAWEDVCRPREHVRFLRSLILDIADRFNEGEITKRFIGEAHPLTWPGAGTVLRNI